MDEFEEIFKTETKNIELRERQFSQHQNNLIIADFNMLLVDELNSLHQKLKTEEAEALENQRLELDEKWTQKFKETVQGTVRELTTEFLHEMDRQKSILINNFKFELQ